MSADTIYALASGAGRAAIAVLRVSGPGTRRILEAIAGRIPEPRVAALATFANPATGEAIDRGLALFFPGPRSVTGEDYAELHVHGGRAVVKALIAALGSLSKVRAAEPGEFTRRGLLNGRLDLAQVEGLADLIEAETEWQRRQALRQTQGALGARLAPWRAALLEAAALIEAAIDFPDEGDVAAASGVEAGANITTLLAPVLDGLNAELAAGRAGERIREGLVVVIAGPPNAGKSSLLNALARREVAIVSPQAGTTRDALEVHLDLGGCAVTLIDTAGLRESEDAVERIGVARALEKAKSADLVLWLSEAGDPVAVAGMSDSGAVVWTIFTKSDLASAPEPQEGLAISARTGRNLDHLIDRIAEFAASATGEGHAGLITQARHRKAFEDAAQAIGRIIDRPDAPIEFRAEDLRFALFSLQRLTGAVDVEDILGEIFARFCIGK